MTTDAHLEELQQLLSETVETARIREQAAFDKAAAPHNKSIVLFGAGNWGRRFARCLRKEGTEPLAFSDNNSALWGKSIEGVPVLSPKDAAERYRQQAVFVISISNGHHSLGDHTKQLSELGCAHIVPGIFLGWKFGDELLPHMWHNRPSATIARRDEVIAGCKAMSDEFSRKEFVGLIRWRLTADTSGLFKGPFWEPESYFPPKLFDPSADEVLLDGGAYVGDTLRDFLTKCSNFRGRLIAFEPDPSNRAKLTAFQQGLPKAIADGMVIVPKGLWNREEVLRFNADGTMESFIDPNGNIEIPTIDIDSVCQSLSIAPTLIKMDIQGAEPQAMEGAKRMIEKHKPLLAISVYHRFDDLWTIPNFSKALNPDYHFVLWPRMHEGWEMVMFGIPKHRVKRAAAQ